MKIKLLGGDNKNLRQSLLEFFYINVGIFLVALGVHFFKNPNRFALGGVSGVSIILANYFPTLPTGAIMTVLNAAIIVFGFLFLGRDVATKSFYSSFALSGMVWVLEVIAPISAPLTNQSFMELIYGVFLPGVGGAIVFNYGATTGGTDIIAKILSKHLRIKTSYSLLYTDFIIAAAAGMVFGIQSGLFSILGVCLKVFVMDSFLESLQVKKIFVIVSRKSDEIKEFICKDLHRGATVNKATGAYTIEEKDVITTVVSRGQAVRLKDFCNKVDPGAFITISNSSEIVGNGFRRFE